MGVERSSSSRRDNTAPPSNGDRTFAIALPHSLDRLEPMSSGAVAIGSDGEALHFTSLELGANPRAIDRHLLSGATQGELRSHGYFYRARSESEGIVGLPVRNVRAPGAAHIIRNSSGVHSLNVENLRFTELGTLVGLSDTRSDDCQVSCVDWYGNTRPLFVHDRIFGLLGYEFVEGRLERGTLAEVGRASFHPSTFSAEAD